MIYSDIKLYVMSGTGNTYRVAQWIMEAAEKDKIPAEIAMIDKVNREDLKPHKDGLFGMELICIQEAF